MKPCVIVTEGTVDIAILKAVLEMPAGRSVQFVPAGSRSAADSLARSLLVNGDADVALVVDADSVDPDRVDELRRFLNQSLREMPSRVGWHVFVFVPGIEAILFEDRSVIESVVGRSVSDLDLVRGQFEPRQVLQQLLSHRPNTDDLARLQRADLAVLREIPEIQRLNQFVGGASRVTAA
jgi:hypothetical protein